jgi:hypothetical protein
MAVVQKRECDVYHTVSDGVVPVHVEIKAGDEVLFAKNVDLSERAKRRLIWWANKACRPPKRRNAKDDKASPDVPGQAVIEEVVTGDGQSN